MPARNSACDRTQAAEAPAHFLRCAFRLLHYHAAISCSRVVEFAETEVHIADLREHQIRVELVVAQTDGRGCDIRFLSEKSIERLLIIIERDLVLALPHIQITELIV